MGTSLRVVYNGDPIPTMPPAYKCALLSFRTPVLMCWCWQHSQAV